MLGSIGAAFNPDVHADVEIEHDLALEAGSKVQPTQPPHPSLVVDMPSDYPEDFDTFSTPDTVDIANIDVTPLASGVDATSCPDLSVAVSTSISVDVAASTSVESGAHREI